MICTINTVVFYFYLISYNSYKQMATNLGEYRGLQTCQRAQKQVSHLGTGLQFDCISSGRFENEQTEDKCS